MMERKERAGEHSRVTSAPYLYLYLYLLPVPVYVPIVCAMGSIILSPAGRVQYCALPIFGLAHVGHAERCSSPLFPPQG